jgi:hypothetical protein
MTQMRMGWLPLSVRQLMAMTMGALMTGVAASLRSRRIDGPFGDNRCFVAGPSVGPLGTSALHTGMYERAGRP